MEDTCLPLEGRGYTGYYREGLPVITGGGIPVITSNNYIPTISLTKSLTRSLRSRPKTLRSKTD